MREVDPASRQQVLDHPQAERETETKPHRMGDDFSRKAMAAIMRITVSHAPSSHTVFHVS